MVRPAPPGWPRRVWVVDPLDGTREFSEPPRDDWAVHVALVSAGRAHRRGGGAPGPGPGAGTDRPPACRRPPPARPRIVVSRTRPRRCSRPSRSTSSARSPPSSSAGAAVLRRQGLHRDAAPGREGLLAGPHPVPGDARRHRAQLPRGLEFRDRRVAELGVKLVVASVQDAIDRAGRRGDRAPRRAATGSRPRCCSTPSRSTLRRRLRRRPARRGEGPGQGARLLASATSSASGTRRTSAPSCGASTTAATTRASTSGCSRSATGPSSTSGSTSPRGHRDALDLLRPRARGLRARRHVAGGHALTCRGRRRGGRERGALPHRGRRHLHRRGRVAADTVEEVIAEVAATRITERGATRADDKRPRRPWKTARRRATSDAELLRFATAGSVDDGKSTLIGRLLYDSKSIFEDQLEAVERISQRAMGAEYTNLALLTDGLRAEREQGITIDVAYRYFATPSASSSSPTPRATSSTPATWSPARPPPTWRSCCRRPQGRARAVRRHAFIASLLRIPHLVVCVNKMDLVDWTRSASSEIVDEFRAFAPSSTSPT
jgi:hypothetical protein